jgi:hypothetical protein
MLILSEKIAPPPRRRPIFNEDADDDAARKEREDDDSGAVREVVGIGRGAFSGNMKVSFQAARSIG